MEANARDKCLFSAKKKIIEKYCLMYTCKDKKEDLGLELHFKRPYIPKEK